MDSTFTPSILDHNGVTLQPIVFEICCGAAGLSSALRRLGFTVYAIDHSANRHTPKVKTLVLDVSNGKQLSLLESMMRFSKPCYVHLGLPCGTCSRAREKPLPKKLGNRMGPPPLRDADHLMGFPDLQGANLHKVSAANSLYKAAITLLQLCFTLQCLVSIENPARSWLWALLAALVHETQDEAFMQWYSGLESVYFDACMHGSLRDKRTKLLASTGLFSTLALDCTGNHKHASWQPFKNDNGVVFPTAMEAEYPTLLCNRMAQCVLQSAAKLQVVPVIQPRLKDLLNLGLGQQTLRHDPLIPEFAEVITTDMPSTNEAHKLLAAPFSQGHNNTELQNEAGIKNTQLDDLESQPEVEHADDGQSEQPRKKCRGIFKYGVWHTPEQFLDKAQRAVHPMDDECYLHDITKQAIKRVVATDPLALAKERLATVFNLRRLTQELADQETRLKQGQHPDVRKCTESKNVSLFEHVLKELGYRDMQVVELLKDGVPLVGLQDAPAGYREQLVPASITEDELLDAALWRRKMLMGQHKQITAAEESALLEATADEISRGFLQGPYSEDEMTVLQEDEKWSLNHRFVLFQGTSGKVRVIDDARRSAVNSAYSSTIKLQLQDIDYAANMVMLALKEAEAAGIPVDQWMGKTFDLSKAYKQLAVKPSHQRHAVVGFPIQGSWQFYRSIALPFGCTGSVYGFVRISQAIWFILCRLLGAVMCHYFDDFPTIEREPGCRVLSLAVSAVLGMLGWEHAKEGDKAQNFAVAFDLLGVNFNLNLTPSGLLQVTNKVTRLEKLCKMLDDIASEGEISSSKASELQGLLNFAVGFFAGKSLKHLVSAFSPFADQQNQAKSCELKDLCEYAKFMLKTLKPRQHSTRGVQNPILTFTDGAWEQGIASAGVVLIDGSKRMGYSIEVPQQLVDHWLQHAGEQIISQIELWALVSLRWTMRSQFEGRRILSWIDNEAARACAIKATSPSKTMRSLARALADMEALWPVYSWVERVCSYSNPGDLPSRNRLSEAVIRYNVEDGGTLSASTHLTSAVLQLADRPYSVALLSNGGTST